MVSSVGINAQTFDPDRPMIIPFEVCGAEVQGLVNVGASSMTRYEHKYHAPARMNTYLVKEIKRGKKTYLRIYNSYNGV